MRRKFLMLLAAAALPGFAWPGRAESAWREVLAQSLEYRLRLQELIPLYEKELTAATKLYDDRSALFRSGLIARVDLEALERSRDAARDKLDGAKSMLRECEQLIAEVRLAEELEKARTAATAARDHVIFYAGKARWTLDAVPKLEEFYSVRFREPLPVSAYGQTALHTRMGFSHHQAVDLAVHPDSEEGRQLMEFLRTSGISFIAFREALSGSATGAHIHVGKPSSRVGTVGLHSAAGPLAGQ